MTPSHQDRRREAEARRRANLAAHLETLGEDLAARVVREDLRAVAELGPGATEADAMEAVKDLRAGKVDVVLRWRPTTPLESLPGVA